MRMNRKKRCNERMLQRNVLMMQKVVTVVVRQRMTDVTAAETEDAILGVTAAETVNPLIEAVNQNNAPANLRQRM